MLNLALSNLVLLCSTFCIKLFSIQLSTLLALHLTFKINIAKIILSPSLSGWVDGWIGGWGPELIKTKNKLNPQLGLG